MWPSNSFFNFKTVLLSANFLLLISCSLPKPQDRGDIQQSAATYYVDKADASVTSQTQDENISLPVSKTYSFSVCLKDNKMQKPVVNHGFHLLHSTQDKELTSDANGCVLWSENIAYNHLADAKIVEVERSLSAHGFHQGDRHVSFALNPWEDIGYSLLAKKVKDLVGADQAQKILKGLDEKGQVKKSSIWFDDLRLNIDEKRINTKGTVLNFEIRTQPNFSVTKSSGQKVLEPITRGEFEGELSLIHVVSVDQKEVIRYLAAPVKFSHGKINNNFLTLDAPLQLEKNCTRGQVQLGLKISPVHAPEFVKGFEGVFIIGECDQIKGNSFARLKNVFQDGKIQNIESYLTDHSDPFLTAGQPRNSQDPQLSSDTTQADYYQNGQVEIKKLHFENVAFTNQNSLHRKKTFNVTACMKTSLDPKAMRAQTFKVRKINGENETIRSNDDGCISWDDSLEFNYLAQECWVQKDLQISNSNLGVEQTLKLNINAWSQGESAFRDIRHLGKSAQTLTCAEGKSEIVLTSYSFDRKDVDFDIDSFLNLRVKKASLFKIAPILKRPSLSEPSGFSQEYLPVGPYVLRWAVVDNMVKDYKNTQDQIYQIGEKLVHVFGGGTISELLSLESANVKAIGNTNQILLELVPAKLNADNLLKEKPDRPVTDLVDDQAEMKQQTFMGTLILANNSEGSNLTMIKEGDSLIASLKPQLATDIVRQNKRYTVLSQKESLAKNEHLQLFNLNQDEQTLNLRKSLILPTWWYADANSRQKNTPALDPQILQDPLLSGGQLSPALAHRLCAYWFYDQMQRPLKNIKNLNGAAGISAFPSSLPTAFQVTSRCQSEVRKNPRQWFDLHYRYFVKNVRKLQDLPSQVRDLSIQSSFTMAKGHSDTQTTSFAWDIGAGISAVTPKLFEILGASISTGVRYQKSWSTSDYDSSNAGLSISGGISATVERLSFKLQSDGVEKCVVIRLNPALYAGPKAFLPTMMDRRLTVDEMGQELSKGLLLCQGEAKNAQMEYVENYYVINQKPAGTQVINSNAEQNRPFFVNIRGQRDFNGFMSFLHGTMGIPDAANSDFQTKQMNSDKLSQTFLEGVKAYPGQYQSDK